MRVKATGDLVQQPGQAFHRIREGGLRDREVVFVVGRVVSPSTEMARIAGTSIRYPVGILSLLFQACCAAGSAESNGGQADHFRYVTGLRRRTNQDITWGETHLLRHDGERKINTIDLEPNPMSTQDTHTNYRGILRELHSQSLTKKEHRETPKQRRPIIFGC